STETKLLRQAHACKNKKLRHDQKQTDMLCELDVDILLVTDDIVFDPSWHRIQSASRNISTNDSIYYLEKKWTSIPLCSLNQTDISIEGSSNIANKQANKQAKQANKQLWIAFATKHNTRKEKAQLIISKHNNLKSISKLVQFKHITKPECIMDLSGRTLVHLEQFDDYNTVILATNTVNNYYFYILQNPLYRSDEFWTNFIEHFGAYTKNNLLPFTSSNTASTHNIDHHEYVNKLLLGLKPLSDCINQFLQNYYEDLYTKLSKLSWGPFVLKPFGVFLMIAINFNTTSDYYWDEHDETNSLCVLVVLGNYERGELCFLSFK
ncbi:24431_t:CDS:2, partial [Racocetra persica]